MKKFKVKLGVVLAVIALAAVYYYVSLPAFNIHSADLWMFMIVLVILIAAVYILSLIHI